ncbi:MAG TPA: ABC transporter ATP-binding protein, partial [Gaiella sp.]|nr:ABC transporter ATP-binding protein [Gaiella sp.]
MSLRVDDLTVYYRSLRGDVKAVDGATFAIGDGEIMGLAGESGCGKSSLGKSLIRMDARMKHVRGRVELDGRELPIDDDAKMNAFRFRDVSIVPQYSMSALTPTRKVGTVAHELLESRGVAFAEVQPELVRRLELVGLSAEVLDRYPIELSGGMKQRTVMVLSTLLDPSLLIADEITSALDVSSQRAVGELLVEFRDRGFVKSMIVITHDLAILYQIADTILVMYAGKLAEKASAETIVVAPRHPYTRLLISSLPEVGVRFEETRLAGIPGKPPSL